MCPAEMFRLVRPAKLLTVIALIAGPTTSTVLTTISVFYVWTPTKIEPGLKSYKGVTSVPPIVTRLTKVGVALSAGIIAASTMLREPQPSRLDLKFDRMSSSGLPPPSADGPILATYEAMSGSGLP
jgi:hypothetical protein